MANLRWVASSISSCVDIVWVVRFGFALRNQTLHILEPVVATKRNRLPDDRARVSVTGQGPGQGPAPLERVSKHQLDVALRVLAGDLAESCVQRIEVRSVPIRVIRKIEELRP